MSPIIISIEEKEALLTKLDTNKYAGLRRSNSILYFKTYCAHEIAPILQVIYNIRPVAKRFGMFGRTTLTKKVHYLVMKGPLFKINVSPF